MASPIITITKPLNGFTAKEVSVSGSKYLANRLLIIATLADGNSILHNLPENQDIEIASKGVVALGAKIEKEGSTWQVKGTGGKIKTPASVYTGENGTFSRFAVALAGLGDRPVSLNSAPRMQQRPMGDILCALRNLGAKVDGEAFPLTITGPLQQGEISLKGKTSSQYFSALTLALPYARGEGESRIHITTPLVSENYLTMTLDLMKYFGGEARWEPPEKKTLGGTVVVSPGQYRGREYHIEADPVSATYFMALAALSSESLLIHDFNPHSLQGEGGFFRILERMGCKTEIIKEAIRITPPDVKLQGIEVDMTHLPDAVPTLAVLAANAEGKTRITGIAHLRHKESNRIEDMAEELRKAGIKVKTGHQFIEIEGGIPCPALFDSHDDHRLAMSLSLLSLRSREVKIKNFTTVKKSFPSYFEKLQKLGFAIIL